MLNRRSATAVDENDVSDDDIKPHVDAMVKMIQQTNRERRALKKKLQKQTEAVILVKDEYEMKLTLQAEKRSNPCKS